MKKAIFSIFLSAAITCAVNAQKLDAAKVPVEVKAAFSKQHPGIKAKWENEKGQFEAGFKKDGTAMSVLYTADGVLTETEMDIKTSALPVAVQSYIKDHYKAAVIKEASKITRANGTVTYEAEINKMDVLFDADGKFLKEVKD